jgi:hypothetical protein
MTMTRRIAAAVAVTAVAVLGGTGVALACDNSHHHHHHNQDSGPSSTFPANMMGMLPGGNTGQNSNSGSSDVE